MANTDTHKHDLHDKVPPVARHAEHTAPQEASGNAAGKGQRSPSRGCCFTPIRDSPGAAMVPCARPPSSACNRLTATARCGSVLQRAGAPGSSSARQSLPRAAGHSDPLAVQREDPPGATTTPATPAPAPAAEPASDPAIDALDLSPTAKAAALALKKLHPEIVFTSGRRDVTEQAHAMAVNIVSSKNRNWIKDTYKSAATLQQWVDDHAEATTVDAIATGLETSMNAMSDSDRGKVSKHLGGAAFDVQPQEKDADQIKTDIQALPGLASSCPPKAG